MVRGRGAWRACGASWRRSAPCRACVTSACPSGQVSVREVHGRVAGALGTRVPAARVFGCGGQRLAGVAVAGDRRRRFGEAAADAGVVEVDRSRDRSRPARLGEEEGVGAGGGGVEEGGAFGGAPAEISPTQPPARGAAALAVGLPLVDVGAAVGVGEDEGVGGVEEEAAAGRRRGRGACRSRWRWCRWRARRGSRRGRAGVRRSGCRRRRSGRRAAAGGAVEVDLGVGFAASSGRCCRSRSAGRGEEGEVRAVGADPGGAGGRRAVASAAASGPAATSASRPFGPCARGRAVW